MIHVGTNIYHLPFSVSGHIVFSNNTSVAFDDDDLDNTQTGWSMDSGVSTLPIGCVCGRSFTLALINDNGQWNNYNFFGAVIDITLNYGNNITVTISNLTVTEPPQSLGTVITMTALDNAWRLDKPYVSQLTYPSSCGAVYREICSLCGITSKTSTHGVFSTSVEKAFDETLTCREVLSYIATVAAGNIRITNDGKMELLTLSVPSQSSTAGTYHDISEWISLSEALHGTIITGVQTSVDDSTTGEASTILIGTDQYVVEIEHNPLMDGRESTILNMIYSTLNGFMVRKFDGSIYNLPTIELFDGIKITDINYYTVFSIITSCDYKLGGGVDISCNVETPASVGNSFDPGVRMIAQARRLVATERTQREQAVEALSQAIAASGGLYETTEAATGGGYIYYLHDKPTLSASTNVIKLTAEALGLSTDGGQTYPVGIMINGDVIARILSADGINADWIDTGALVVKDQTTGAILFSADVGAGAVFIDGIKVDDGVVTVGVNGAQKTVVISDDGIKIQDNGVTSAEFSEHVALLPGRTNITGLLRIGAYQFEPSSAQSGNFWLVYTPEFTT